MKLTKRKIIVLFLLADALLITLPLIATELLRHYYEANAMPIPTHWWFVPYSMGLGLVILLGMLALDIWHSARKWLSRYKR